MPELSRKLVLTRELWREITEHFRQAAPNEAVGLIGGDAGGTAVRVAPLPNLAGLFAFFADPYQQYLAEKGFSQEGLSVLATYHSHPGGGTGLSADDRKMVLARPKCLHLVAAVSWSGAAVAGTEVYAVEQGQIVTSSLDFAD